MFNFLFFLEDRFLFERAMVPDASKYNTPYGDAYETATALYVHNNTGSKTNKDPEHQARIAELQKKHEEALKLLPKALADRAMKSAQSSGESYLQSLEKNRGIKRKDITEVHHTSKGIDKLVGKKVDRKQNPHDIVIKTKSGDLHGASLKATQGTLSNNPIGMFDSQGELSGIKTDLKSIYQKHMKKVGLAGLSGDEIKAQRDREDVKSQNKAAQAEAAQAHADAFNNGSKAQQLEHLKYLMKTAPDLDYDYVNGEKGYSKPVGDLDHNKAVREAKSLNAKVANNVVKIYDHLGRHILSVEHRPTHGAFSSIQANAKLGTLNVEKGAKTDAKKLVDDIRKGPAQKIRVPKQQPTRAAPAPMPAPMPRMQMLNHARDVMTKA